MRTAGERTRMVEQHLARRGIADPRVLEAFRQVAREDFVPAEMVEFAYRDTPLPIAGQQTISQPYIVALTAEALGLGGDEKVLEIGTGSGYAAAVLARLAGEVYTVERLPELAETARARLARLGFANVHVQRGDGTLGWAEHAPYDAIAVAAGGPAVPQTLLAQLRPGGRLVMPVGASEDTQELIRVTRSPDGASYRRESLGSVRFVPLIGKEGWPEAPGAAGGSGAPRVKPAPARAPAPSPAARLVRETAEPLRELDGGDLDPLLERIGDARVVLLGECTHGTSEFYRLRARLTRELIARRGFSFVAIEGDWPDAMRVQRWIRDERPLDPVDFEPFARFPTWMWRNRETGELIDWLRAHNRGLRDPERRAGFYGLDLYSMFTSCAHVLAYLDGVDAEAAAVARARYGLLTPWQKDPAAYGRAVLVGRYASAEADVVATLRGLLERRLDYARKDGERFFDATQNAHLIADAERYYRAMYYASAASWNLRDSHMFETLAALLAFHGPEARAVVWAHNSHVGDARATEMRDRGELNLGELCRERLGPRAYNIGFGTDRGTVAAAAGWDLPMQVMRVLPARADSYERICHDAGVPAFLLHLRAPRREVLRDELGVARLERAIGVVYRPDSERASHYFEARLPEQFDEWIWIDETTAVDALPVEAAAAQREPPDTYPFGL